jgi:Type II secretion system (T2SS), protein E, N-terminal domain
MEIASAGQAERRRDMEVLSTRMAADQPGGAGESGDVSPASDDAFFLNRPRLGDLLLRKGLITAEQLSAAVVEGRTQGELLGRVLIRLGYVFEDELARTLAEQLQLPYVNLKVVGVDSSVARMLPAAEGRRAAAIPVALVGNRVRVAFADPGDDTARAIVQQYIPVMDLAVGELSDIESAWRRVDPGPSR